MNTFIGTSTNNDLAEALQGAFQQMVAPPDPSAVETRIDWTVEKISGSRWSGRYAHEQELSVTISSNAIPRVPPVPPADARADEKLTAFLDLERAIHEFAARFLADGLK
jgi:hypothetical protein